MIRPCRDADLEAMFAVINEAAAAYRGVIPADCWREPYMSAAELRAEIAAGVAFSGFELAGELVAVMGLQRVREVTLIRHAYTRPARQRQGIGARLLEHLGAEVQGPLLVGTWAAADWAIRFYQRRGFRLTTEAEKERLLRAYWTVPPRQIETSVVLSRGGSLLSGRPATSRA